MHDPYLETTEEDDKNKLLLLRFEMNYRMMKSTENKWFFNESNHLNMQVNLNSKNMLMMKSDCDLIMSSEYENMHA